MRRFVYLFALTVGVSGVSGCISLVSAPTTNTTTYVLSPPPPAVATEQGGGNQVLYVAHATAPAYLDGTRIVFSRDDLTRNSYQYAQWAEPLPARLTTLLVEALAATNNFKAVTRQTGVAAPDLALTLEVLDFRHVAGTLPGEATVTLRATLSGRHGGEIVEALTVSKNVPLTAGTARAAVTALGEATAQSIAAIVAMVVAARSH